MREAIAMWKPEHEELLHTRLVAERAAFVRLILTAGNFVVILADHSVPTTDTLPALTQALVAAGAFLVYALCAYVLLKQRWISLRHYELTAPLFDIVCSTVLIAFTDGYLSPFNLWMVLAVLGTAFSRYRWLPYLTAGLGLAGHTVIAFIPQEQPFPLSTFVVRTSFLFAVGTVAGFLGSMLTRQSEYLTRIESAGREFSDAASIDAAIEILIRYVSPLYSHSLVVFEAWHGQKEDPPRLRAIRFRNEILGFIRATPGNAFNRAEERYLSVLCNRTANTFRRLQLAAELAEKAALQERLRITDELHDELIQTLAALDLRIAALSLAAEAGDAGAYKEAATNIPRLVKLAMGQARDLLGEPKDVEPASAESLAAMMRDKWEHEADISIEEGISLRPEAWTALEMLVREGLNNARGHGHAGRIKLKIGRGPMEISCILEDDGRGPGPNIREGYGLRRIRTLVEEAGGEFHFGPADAGGARLIATFESDAESSCADR